MGHESIDFDKESDFFIQNAKMVKSYPDLHFTWENDIAILSGVYHFCGNYKNIELIDDFKLKIQFPRNFPNYLPKVYSVDRKIPDNYHKMSDGAFCLGTAIEIFPIFRKNPNIKNFIENLLNPYLYRWKYLQEFNKEPWGEYSHGPDGIYEGYSKLFNTNNLSIICFLLNIFLEGESDSNLLCPCNSGKKIKICHRKAFRKLETVPKNILYNDYLNLKGHLE